MINNSFNEITKPFKDLDVKFDDEDFINEVVVIIKNHLKDANSFSTVESNTSENIKKIIDHQKILKQKRTDSYGVKILKKSKKHKVNIKSVKIEEVEIENYKRFNCRDYVAEDTEVSHSCNNCIIV